MILEMFPLISFSCNWLLLLKFWIFLISMVTLMWCGSFEGRLELMAGSTPSNMTPHSVKSSSFLNERLNYDEDKIIFHDKLLFGMARSSLDASQV